MKSNTQIQSPRAAKRKWLLVGTIVLVAAAIAVAGTLTLNNLTRNPAEDVAKPLEQALIANGAVKKCSQADAGYGPDNREPNYGGRYQLNIGKDEATKLIAKIASDNGFKLNHSDSPYESIEWYSDESSKESSHSDLERGKVRLSISTYNDTSKQVLKCLDGTALQGDVTHTAVSLAVTLPPRK